MLDSTVPARISKIADRTGSEGGPLVVNYPGDLALPSSFGAALSAADPSKRCKARGLLATPFQNPETAL